jgi:hypothetical protein
MDDVCFWLIENKEWLFSGAGVAAFTAGVLLVKRAFSRSPPEPITQLRPPPATLQQVIDSPPEPDSLPPEPTLKPTHLGSARLGPKEILRRVDELPLLQRASAIEHYKGLSVDWAGRLQGASKQRDGTVRLAVDVDDKMVFCTVDPAAFPGLGLLLKGAPIRVMGSILDVDSLYVELEKVTLAFDVT